MHGRHQLSFDPFAQDPQYIRLNARFVDVILGYLDRPAAIRLLDLGTGTALIARLFRRRWQRLGVTATIVCLDPDCAALAGARAALAADTIHFLVGKAETLPLRGLFDAVAFCNSIHLLEDDAKERAIQEVARVLRPGGLFALNTTFYSGAYPHDTKRVYYTMIRNALATLNTEIPGRRKTAGSVAMRWLSADEYASMVQAAGLRVLHVHERQVMLTQASLEAISSYRDFAQGALRAVSEDVGAASRALVSSVRPSFKQLGIARLPRNWLEVVARKE